jgi:hypothetical protein
MQVDKKTFSGVRLEEMPDGNEWAFNSCAFSGGSIGLTARKPEERLIVRGVVARRCVVASVVVGPVVFENLEVSDLRTTDHLWLAGCAFKNCILRGRIGRILLFAEVEEALPLSYPKNAAFHNANLDIYRQVDYALDISEAQFVDWDCRSVPAHLIRTNPDYQVRVSYESTRRSLASGALSEAPEDIRVGLQWALKNREATRFDFVLTTHPGHKRYQEKMKLFELLRRAGVLLG